MKGLHLLEKKVSFNKKPFISHQLNGVNEWLKKRRIGNFFNYFSPTTY